MPHKSNENICAVTVLVYEDGRFSEKDDFLVRERLINIIVNCFTVETLPALGGQEQFLAAGYLYQTTDLKPEILLSGQVVPEGYSLTVPGFKELHCMCKSIFTLKRTHKILTGAAITLQAEKIHSIFNSFDAVSENFRRTAALHGGALFDAQGTMEVFAEDISRSNVLYKLTGYLLDKNTAEQRIIVVSCRINLMIFNILNNIGFKTIITRASVTHEARAAAIAEGVTLIGFVKAHRFTVFSGADTLEV